MEIKGDDNLLNTSRITEWTLNKGGYLSVLFGGLLLFGCLISYVIAVLRGSLDAYLPLISDAAGSPPQNGIFGTLICFGGIIGVFFMFLRYMIVMEQNRQESEFVKMVNRASLGIGFASLFGITLIAGYPINFYRDREVWLKYVGLPHMIGGVALFSLGLLYAALQCVLTFILRPGHRFILFCRVLLCLSAATAFIYHLATVPGNFGNSPTTEPIPISTNSTNDTDFSVPLASSSKPLIDMTESYISSAIAEWTLVLLFCLFFFTFFSEAQEYSLQIIIETQMPEASSEVAIDDVYRYKDGPSAYVRKTSHAFGATPIGVNGIECSPDGNIPRRAQLYTRRDSSCQTILDLPSNPKIRKDLESKITSLSSEHVSNGTRMTSDKQDVLNNGNTEKWNSNDSTKEKNAEALPGENASGTEKEVTVHVLINECYVADVDDAALARNGEDISDVAVSEKSSGVESDQTSAVSRHDRQLE